MTIKVKAKRRVIKHTMRSAYMQPNRSTITCNDGLTEQHHAEECDVNKILATYMKTGQLPQSDPNAQYGDAADYDFQSMQVQIAQAKSLFEELPEQVKAKFEFEPHRFLAFVEDERNHDELVQMGLANAPTTTLEDDALPSGATDEVLAKAPASQEAERVDT